MTEYEIVQAIAIIGVVIIPLALFWGYDDEDN